MNQSLYPTQLALSCRHTDDLIVQLTDFPDLDTIARLT